MVHAIDIQTVTLKTQTIVPRRRFQSLHWPELDTEFQLAFRMTDNAAAVCVDKEFHPEAAVISQRIGLPTTHTFPGFQTADSAQDRRLRHSRHKERSQTSSRSRKECGHQRKSAKRFESCAPPAQLQALIHCHYRRYHALSCTQANTQRTT